MTRYAVVFFLAGGLFLSCVSLPKPVHDTDSLVIGGVVWEFPDGFFQYSPRTFRNNITLVIANLTTGEQFKLKSKDGYFAFLSNGKDKYMLQYAALEGNGPGEDFTVGYELNLPIRITPSRIINIGRITITFASPEISEAKQEDTVIRSYWRFRQEYIVSANAAEVKEYLAAYDGEGLWRERPIVHLYER